MFALLILDNPFNAEPKRGVIVLPTENELIAYAAGLIRKHAPDEDWPADDSECLAQFQDTLGMFAYCHVIPVLPLVDA